jgi:phosphoglycerate-specific signal transduction histidine kinase
MTDAEMKELQGFPDEIIAIRDEMEKGVKQGFTETTLQDMQALIARMDDLVARQKAFGRKHSLTP